MRCYPIRSHLIDFDDMPTETAEFLWDLASLSI